MQVILWDNSMSVNIREIDIQHKALIELMNQMNAAAEMKKGEEALGTVLAGLVNYTVYHFFSEEQLMEAYGYPGYHEHKEEHIRLTERTLALYDQYQAGDVSIVDKVLDLLNSWLTNHIKESDKKYSSFLNSKGVN